jgi:hypothetical protein
MSIGEKVQISINGEDISTVTSYKFLGSPITSYGNNKEENKRISLGKAAMSKLTKIMKDSGASTISTL